MTIVHIVMFHFPTSVPSEVTEQVLSQAESLKEKCLHPKTGKPYILSYKGGKDCSTEGIQGGVSHSFVMEFANAEDRDYYVQNDPVHSAFIADIQGKGWERVQVTDFVVEEY